MQAQKLSHEWRSLYGLVRDVLAVPASDIVLLGDADVANCAPCQNYGLHFSCPPYARKPSDMAKVVRSYSSALSVVLEGRPDRQNETNMEMLMLEHNARKDRFKRAQSFFAYYCSFCETCPADSGAPVAAGGCRNPAQMRQTVDTFVDVFGTLENTKQPFRRYVKCEDFDMYSIVLLE